MGSPDSSLMAVNVALIPPEWVQERAREINRTLAAGGLLLDAAHIPHITLAQLFVMRCAVPLLIERLNLVLREAPAQTNSVIAVVNQNSTISFLLDRTPELMQLHESLMNSLQEWEEEGGSLDAFYLEGQPARDQDVDWVTNFRGAASYRNFIPHITLGFGQAPGRSESFEFVANQIGLYQLGRCCTCRVALNEWQL